MQCRVQLEGSLQATHSSSTKEARARLRRYLEVALQQGVGEGVEGACPQVLGGHPVLLQPLPQLHGGLVGEGDGQDVLGGDVL
jgi:hypothetical protein